MAPCPWPSRSTAPSTARFGRAALRPTEELFTDPREDYSRALLAAIAGQRRAEETRESA